MGAFHRILMATDFSPVSDAALEEAARIARESGARLYVVYAYEVPAGGSYVPASGYLASIAATRMEAEQKMQDLMARDSMRGVEARPVILKGPADVSILETAVREKVDMIVMGTHGRRGAARLLLGSVAERVIAAARCPVLTIRTPPPREIAATSAA